MVESDRCMTWKDFRESLYNVSGKRVNYIDEEGTEIPINTEAEFQEALRLAKKQGNRVRFVLSKDPYEEVRKYSGKTYKSRDKYAFKDAKHSKGWMNDADYRESKEALYVNDVPPEWFLSYMNRFKKDFLTEVNNTIYEAIRKAFTKEARLYDERLAREYEWDLENNCVGTQYYYRSENGYDTPAYFVTNQPLPAPGSMKVRASCLDQLMNDRRSQQYARMEKTRLSPSSDRQQRPDFWMNVPTMGMENRMRSLMKPYPKVYVTYVHDFGPIKPIKSASFTSNMSLKKLEVLQPYALWFLLGNNGSVPWGANAFVKCFYNPEEFDFEDNVIELPSLEPGVGANVVYEVTPLKVGSYSFTCAIIDNGSEIGDRILCRFDVVDEEGKKIPKVTRMPVVRKEPQKVTHKITQKIKERFDDEFTKTQKKIKDNIKTIMRRLDDIEVLSSDTIAKIELKKKEEDPVKVGQKRIRKKRKEGAAVEPPTGAFDLLQNLESIRENEEGKPKDEKEIVNDKLVRAEDKNQAKEDKKDKGENNRKKNEEEDGGSDCNQSTKDDSQKEAGDTERRDSDSELSVIMGSEEDDNFIVLSMPSRTPTPETEVKELDDDEDEDEIEEKQKEIEKQKQMEMEIMKQKEMEIKKQKEIEKQKQKEMEIKKQKEMEIKKQMEIEKQKQKEMEMEKQKEMEKEKEKGKAKEKDAEQNESPRVERGTFKFEGNIFDQWNVMKSDDSGRFDPWNEKKNPRDPFEDTPKDIDYWKKWGFHVVNFNIPENAAKLNGNRYCVLDTMNTPADVLAHLKNSNIINKDGVFLSQEGTGNVVFVVDTGGKCVPVLSKKAKESAEVGKPRESAEAVKPRERAEMFKPKETAEMFKPKETAEMFKPRESAGAGRQRKSAETKESKEKETKGEGSYGTQYRGSATRGEQPMNFPGLVLFSAASNATTKDGSAPINTPSTFHLGGSFQMGQRTTWGKGTPPHKLMEMLTTLDAMGFTDWIKNRKLLLKHNFNMFAVVQDLINESKRSGHLPHGGVYAIKPEVFGLF